MLANFFDKTKPINSLIIAFSFCLFYLVFFISQEGQIVSVITIVSGLGLLFLHLLFLFLLATTLIKNRIEEDDLYTSFIIVLLYGMFPSVFLAKKTLLIGLLSILFYSKISTLNTKKNTIRTLFDSGFIIGVLMFLFNWILLFFPLIYIALILFKKVSFRHLIIPIVGVISPIILGFTYFLMQDTLQIFYEIFHFKNTTDLSLYIDSTFKIPIIVMFITTLISVLATIPKIISISDAYRGQYAIVLFMLLIELFLVILTPVKNGSELLYLFIPIGVVIAKFIKDIPKYLFKELLLIALTLFSAVMMYKDTVS